MIEKKILETTTTQIYVSLEKEMYPLCKSLRGGNKTLETANALNKRNPVSAKCENGKPDGGDFLSAEISERNIDFWPIHLEKCTTIYQTTRCLIYGNKE